MDYLDPTLIDHLSPYLNVCPIRHPLWLSVSCGSQDSTVQGSSPYKCDQKSSCSAFNAVTAALSQIFPSSCSSSIFVMLALSNGVSWKVALSERIYVWSVLCLFEETLLFGPPFLTFPLACYLWDFELNTLTIVHSSSDHLPFIPYLWDFKPEHLITVCPSLDHSTSSNKT